MSESSKKILLWIATPLVSIVGYYLGYLVTLWNYEATLNNYIMLDFVRKIVGSIVLTIMPNIISAVASILLPMFIVPSGKVIVGTILCTIWIIWRIITVISLIITESFDIGILIGSIVFVIVGIYAVYSYNKELMDE